MKKISKQELILESIIQEYLKSHMPIGSSELQMKLTLEMSPSTIRIYFKKLSDIGSLVQLHVSSGRVPTQQALMNYWRKRIDINKPVFIKNVEKVQKSTKEHHLFCMIERNSNALFKELVNVQNRFLILVFDTQEVVLKYNVKVEQFLIRLVGCSMRALKDISAQVGLYELHEKLATIFSQLPLLKEGEQEMYAIAKEMQTDTFIHRFQKLHFLESLDNGLYFEEVVPDGCMAIKCTATLEEDGTDAEIFCFGRIGSDFEGFFNNVKE
ncbi:MAG: HrcA family transcriptional regulator [Sulfurospirillaceae bacterium]|nr:HrcA family transcriptional regulator [Sulfurospirillaceae bacterium]MDD2825896.1 HrcA family transcriptional regulator [Sulfurospirillaceae bacterium]